LDFLQPDILVESDDPQREHETSQCMKCMSSIRKEASLRMVILALFWRPKLDSIHDTLFLPGSLFRGILLPFRLELYWQQLIVAATTSTDAFCGKWMYGNHPEFVGRFGFWV
jgi:hypothetical protein